MKTTKEAEEIDNSKGKIMLLKCDLKSKEERVQCEDKCENERAGAKGNIGLQCRNRSCERRTSHVFKRIDSMRNLEEYMQN